MRSNQVLWRGLFVMLVVAVGVMSACGGATPAPKGAVLCNVLGFEGFPRFVML